MCPVLNVNSVRRAVWSCYDFDLATLELRRHGRKIRLEYKPAQILYRLLEQPKELVARGELIEFLWPDESHGDFEPRLNKAVHKLRSVLRDDSASPVFIQTLSREGYRFIAEVQFVKQSGGMTDAASGDNSGDGEIPVAPTFPAEAQLATRRAYSAKWLGWVSAVALLSIAGAFYARTIYTSSASLKTHKSVAILGFANTSGNSADEWISAGLADWIASDLTTGSELRSVSKEDVARFRSEQGLKVLDEISPSVLAKIGRDMGADLVLSGTYAASGLDGNSRMRLDVQVQDARSGGRLFSVSATGSRAEIFDLASSAGAQLRTALRLSPIPPPGLSSMRSVLPVNPDAARFYTEGMTEIEAFDAAQARMLLQRAVALEPEHALSHAALSTADTMLGLSADAREEARKGFDLGRSLGVEQRLLIEGQFHEANYERDKAVETYSRLFQLFPDRTENGVRLARAQTLDGKPLDAIGTVAQMRHLSLPSNDRARLDIAEAEAASYMSDYQGELDAAGRAANIASQSGALLLLARAEEEQGEAQRALGHFSESLSAWKDAETRYVAVGDRSAVARLMIDEGQLHRQRGDPQQADVSYSNAVSISKQIGDDATLGRALIALAQVRMFSVGPVEGNRLCDEALKIFQNTGNKKEEAYALSVIADIASDDDRQRAIELYQRSLALSREVNDRSRIAGRLMDLGIQERVQGNLAAADKYIQESLSIYHDIGERNREALVLNLLSMIRTQQGRLEEADRMSGQAVEILSTIQETVPLAQSRQNLATVRMEEGKLTEAESILNVALTEHQRADNSGGVAITSAQLAEVFVLERKLPESEAALERFEEVRRKNQNWRGESVTQSLIVRAKIDAAEGHTRRAQQQALQAVHQALSTGQGTILMEAKLALDEIELQGGDTALGRRSLDGLAKEADSKGFKLIGDEARRTLASQRLPSTHSTAQAATGNGKT